MNKSRIESFSDGVFSIVMTLLVFNIKIPTLAQPTDAQLWYQLGLIWPSILIYIMSFVVLSALWINHHFLFSGFAKSVNRQLNLLNLLYLLFVVFVPFSANLIGVYSTHRPAAILYGINIFCIVLISTIMATYIHRSSQIVNEKLSRRELKQARFRSTLSLASYLVGILCAFIYIPASIFFYTFPVIFNIIPGSLNFAEKLFRFTLE